MKKQKHVFIFLIFKYIFSCSDERIIDWYCIMNEQQKHAVIYIYNEWRNRNMGLLVILGFE